MERLDLDNTLIIYPIIYAECLVGFERLEKVEAMFGHLGFAAPASGGIPGPGRLPPDIE